MPKQYTAKAFGENESRELRFSKQADGNYQVQIWWGRGKKALATLNLTPAEMKKLANFSAGLLKK